VDFLPFAKLSNVTVSPRMRNVLEQAYQLTFKEIEAGLKRTLDDFEKELFKLADKAGNNQEQTRMFDALKAVRKSNSQVLMTCRDDYQRGMLGLFNRGSEEKRSTTRGNLSLVDNNTLELDLAVSEIAARAEIKNSQALMYLDVRFAVVCGGAPVASEDLPVGPLRILRAVSAGLNSLEIPVSLKVEFLRLYDKLTLTRLPALYDALNQQLCEQRVFAHLNLGQAPRREEPEKAESKAESKKEDVKKEEPKKEAPEAASHAANASQASSGTQSASAKNPASAAKSASPLASTPAPARAPAASPAANPAVTAPSLDLFAPEPGSKWANTPDPFGLSGIGSIFSADDAIYAQTQTTSGQASGQSAAPRAPSAVPASPQSGAPGAFPPVPPSQAPNQAPHQAFARPDPFQAIPRAPAGPAKPSQNSADVDTELFTTLRELLGSRRAKHEDAGAPVASNDDVQSILTVLQSLPTAPVMVGGKWKSRRIADVKQDMVNQLRQIHGGRTPQLEGETSDTIDLVGMLFDHVMSESKPSSTTHALLTKLQVPILKVALRDKGFFSKRAHPARQLLNSVAENGMFWTEGDDVDEALVERMQMAVDRVTQEFDSDVGVFETMLGDLNSHVNTLQRKAEVAEKRHIDAARGRERLETARSDAAQSIERFTKGRLLPPLVMHLLEGAWADVLALTRLREEPDSPAYLERLDTAEQLAGCFDLDNPVTKEHFEELKPVLEEGMSLVGFHGPEIDRTLQAVSELVVEGEALLPSLEPAEEREVTELVRNKTRLGEEQDGPKSTSSGQTSEKQSILAHLRGRDERISLSPKEQQTLERLKQMPFGTWFEFTLNQQGERARRKLSWFSPVTGRCLFVNSRGAKVAEKTLEELARDVVRGNANVWEAQDENIIDRAWRSIKDKLKSWTGGEALPEFVQE
jgi:hypothetical protein